MSMKTDFYVCSLTLRIDGEVIGSVEGEHYMVSWMNIDVPRALCVQRERLWIVRTCEGSLHAMDQATTA